MVVDLDYFKHIDDSYGYDVGDLVLQAFADTVRDQLRDSDVLCRLGGEEFAVLLSDTNAEQAMQVRYAFVRRPRPLRSGSEIMSTKWDGWSMPPRWA